MTSLDRKKKLEEIRRTTRTLDGTVDFLLTEIDRRDEALRFYADEKTRKGFIVGAREFDEDKAVSMDTAPAREALGEE